MSNIIKQSTLNLFLDNIVDNISAEDMRLFVENVWSDKENSVRKISNLSQIADQIGIEQNDIIICTEGTDEGMYIALVKDPEIANLQKITSQTTEIPGGIDGQILSLNNGELIWVDRDYTFQVLGTLPIEDIMIERPVAGITYIAENNSVTALVPGIIGDGYTWNGGTWINIGQMRGTQGIIGQNGLPGADGDGFRLKGSDTVTEILFKNSGTPSFTTVGDAWVAEDSGNDSQGNIVNVGDTLVCGNPDIPTWFNVGLFVGEAGTNGTDAYDLAVSQGFVGTETEWIISLNGADGADGADSTVPGPEGVSAYEEAVINGFVGNENAWLTSLIGADGSDGSDGSDASIIFADQATVDAGVSSDEAISPLTLSSSSIISSKEDVIAHGAADQVFVTNNTGDGKGWVDAEIIAPVRSVNGKTGTFNITADDVNLDQVDNTTDMSKPVSNATQAELNLKSDTDHNHTVLNDGLYEEKNPNIQLHISNTLNPHQVTKDQVGLNNIPNDVPMDWPVSTATELELSKTVRAGGDATFNDMDLFLEANVLFTLDGTYLNAPKDPLKGICVILEATASRHAVQYYYGADGDIWTRAYNDDTPGWSIWSESIDATDITKLQDGTYKTTGFTPTVDEDFATKKYVDEVTVSGGLTNTQIAAMYHAEALVDPSFYKFSDADKAKLTGIENNATADQTEAEIVALYQSGNVDYFTTTHKTKLDNIEENASADMTGLEIAQVYETYSDVERFTTAYKLVVGNTTGINTGDQTAAQIEDLLYDGTRDNNKFSNDNLTKLNVLADDNLFKNTYLNDALLNDAWGPGSTNGLPSEGSYAYINNNVDDIFTVRIWDLDDEIWKEVAAASTGGVTITEIEDLLYDGTRDNNKYTDTEKLKLSNIYESSTIDVNAFSGSGYVTAAKLEGPLLILENSLQTQITTNSDDILLKENLLGTPSTNGWVLISQTDGTRSWTDPVTAASTNYHTFTSVDPTSVPNNTIFTDSTEVIGVDKFKFKSEAGVIESILGHRNNYLLSDVADTAVIHSSFSGPVDAGSINPLYVRDGDVQELAFLSNLPEMSATEKITYDDINDITQFDSKIQYQNTGVIPEYNVYDINWGNLDDKDLITKDHLVKLIDDVD
ncbi:MAG: hypothetical protein J7L15_03210, partial [Clostridiales bacterium]|nr:hypothetical protein [Clostridiales bacterium]